jgi:hypothetical protein
MILTSAKDDDLFVIIFRTIHHTMKNIPRASKNHPIPKNIRKDLVHAACNVTFRQPD